MKRPAASSMRRPSASEEPGPSAPIEPEPADQIDEIEERLHETKSPLAEENVPKTAVTHNGEPSVQPVTPNAPTTGGSVGSPPAEVATKLPSFSFDM
eukprot:8918607-Pyramimonas_sp.AAC.1